MLLSLLSERTPYMEFVVGFAACISTLHLYLDYRQLKVCLICAVSSDSSRGIMIEIGCFDLNLMFHAQALRNTVPPKEVKHLYSKSECEVKAAYQKDKLKFGIVHSIFDSALSLTMLIKGYYPYVWKISGAVISFLGWQSGEIKQSIAWVLILSLVSTCMNIPWSLYSTFVLEEKHGFNKTTLSTFFTDLVKSTMLTFVLAPPIISGIVYILLHTGPAMALYMWGFMLGLSLVMLTIYPVFIAPLFNKYTPLEEGELRQKIEELASSLKFPLKKLFVVDGSKRSAHSNAYMYGFFKNKRIVLYDTLINQCNEDQVTAVLAHELGHWKLGHTKFLFLGTQIILGAQLGLFAALRGAPGLYEAFGFIGKGQQPALAALVLFQLLVGPLDEFLSLLQNMVSRAFEFQADAFGVKLGKGKELKEALCILDKENKGPPNVDPWYSTYHYSHPPLPERLMAIEHLAKKSK
jgi:STE24 endopeptidase